MPDWLAKAQATMGGGEAVQPFERPCVCGEILCGERTAEAQHVVCSQCGRDWFVLPRDPYPRLKSRRNKQPLWKRWGNRSADGADQGNGSSSSAEKGTSRQTATISRDRTHAALPTSSVSGLVPMWRAKFSLAKAALRDRLKKAARPVRLVAVGMVVALVATGLWLWHRARIDAASATIVALEPQAEQKLAEHDFAAAERLFGEVVDAVDTLGANDQTARRVRQRHREAIAINDLAAQAPFDLAAEAETLAGNPQEWSDRFQAMTAGRWVILDVTVEPKDRPVDRNDGKSESDEDVPREDLVLLDLPLVAGKYPVRFEMDASVFQRPKPPARVIFAAQYASWRLHRVPKERPVWIVRFNPDTAFLWASSDTYEALGFELDAIAAPPRDILKRQAKLLGIGDSASRTPLAANASDMSKEGSKSR